MYNDKEKIFTSFNNNPHRRHDHRIDCVLPNQSIGKTKEKKDREIINIENHYNNNNHHYHESYAFIAAIDKRRIIHLQKRLLSPQFSLNPFTFFIKYELRFQILFQFTMKTNSPFGVCCCCCWYFSLFNNHQPLSDNERRLPLCANIFHSACHNFPFEIPSRSSLQPNNQRSISGQSNQSHRDFHLATEHIHLPPPI